MEVELSVLLAAIIDNEGGEYTLPVSRYDALAKAGNKGIQIDLLDDRKDVRLYLVEIEAPDDGPSV